MVIRTKIVTGVMFWLSLQELAWPGCLTGFWIHLCFCIIFNYLVEEHIYYIKSSSLTFWIDVNVSQSPAWFFHTTHTYNWIPKKLHTFSQCGIRDLANYWHFPPISLTENHLTISGFDSETQSLQCWVYTSGVCAGSPSFFKKYINYLRDAIKPS